MKWLGLVCLMSTAAHAEPRVFLEGGVVVGEENGLRPKTGVNVGGELDIGVRILPYVSLLAGYRDFGDIGALPGEPGTVNDHAETFSFSAWKLGARFSYPVLPPLSVFGELDGLFGVTQLDDPDFAGGDGLSYGHRGIGGRVGVIGQTDPSRLSASIGVGAAVSYQWFEHGACGAGNEDCLQSWASAELFLRAAY